MTQVAQELVTVTIDEREIKVAKGTGMVETAAAAGLVQRAPVPRRGSIGDRPLHGRL